MSRAAKKPAATQQRKTSVEASLEEALNGKWKKPPKVPDNDPEFDAALVRIRTRLQAVTNGGKEPLFQTDASDLWRTFLDEVPLARKQHYTCNCCRHFIERFGGLAVVRNNQLVPALWDGETDPLFARMGSVVRRASITGVFLTKDAVLGTPTTGVWTHFAADVPASARSQSLHLEPHQVAAEKAMDRKNVATALGEFGLADLEKAHTLLQTESLYRSEKVAGPVDWLLGLQKERMSSPKNLWENILWLAVAKAPAGFCHPRASMAGSLLEDLAAGLPFEDVSRRFAAKMKPDQYQRPQAPPSAGLLQDAEKLVEKMGLANSLKRRFARLDEVPCIWRPKDVPQRAAPTGSVFGHITPKGQPESGAGRSIEMSALTMTWVKFQEKVLPLAEQMHVTLENRRHALRAFTTAEDAAAPPILRWDREERRNSFASYVWLSGSLPSAFELHADVPLKVVGVLEAPHMFGRAPGAPTRTEKGPDKDNATLLLQGAKDLKDAGNALFPETLRSELHGIRSAVAAYSNTATLGGREDGPLAQGISLEGAYPLTLMVMSKGMMVAYKIDRWD